jgi:hypothetical protein
MRGLFQQASGAVSSYLDITATYIESDWNEDLAAISQSHHPFLLSVVMADFNYQDSDSDTTLSSGNSEEWGVERDPENRGEHESDDDEHAVLSPTPAPD